MVYVDNLFDLKQTIALELFRSVTYAWEVLPKIKDYISELAFNLPSGFERIEADIWVGKGTIIEKTVI